MTAMACTLWVPVRNVKNFILLRPPAVVFAFCVASFAVITFSLALHIKHTGYHLRNPDKMNWNDFRSRWNKIEFCHTFAATLPPFNVSSLELSSTSFELDEPLLDLKKVKFVVGVVSSVDLGIDSIPTNLTVILEPVEEPNYKKVCAFIYHSPLFTLPNSSKFCSLPSWPPATDVMTFVERGKQKSHNDCLSGGTPINLNLKEKADEDGAQFLTEDDRATISLHLMASSFFLTALFFTICSFAMMTNSGTKPLPKSACTTIQSESIQETY